MLEDGNCLFRAVADQVYGDSDAYDLTRHMCIDYMVGFFFHVFLFILMIACWRIVVLEITMCSLRGVF